MTAIVDRYLDALRTRGLASSTVTTVGYRLRAVFIGHESLTVDGLTPSEARRLYGELAERQAVDTHRNTLATAKQFGAWMVKSGAVKRNPFEAVEPFGARSRGKAQLRVDEARKLYARCLELAADDDGAVAVLTAMLLGVRASEITARVVRDLDADGRIMWIERGKTRSSDRGLAVPDVLGAHLRRLADGRDGGEPLFGGVSRRGNDLTRQWVYHQVHRLCRLAGVPPTSPHGLRGLHATMAIAAGLDVSAVSRQLGHAGTVVTQEHYIAPGALAQRRASVVADALAGLVTLGGQSVTTADNSEDHTRN